MLQFGILIDAALFVLGIVWCKHIFARLGSDLAEIRAPDTDGADRGVIAGFWLITVLVMCWICGLVVSLF